MSSAEHTKLPVLSTIRAGIPILADKNIGGYIDVPDYLRADFILTVKDDSMIGAGILYGDLAICCETAVVNSGQIVVALNDIDNGFSEATLKCYFDNDKRPVLRPANPNYPEMNMNDGHRIAGVMVSLIRRDIIRHEVYENYLAGNDADEWAD